MSAPSKLALAASVVLMMLQNPLQAADWPQRPIHMVVGYSAGGPTDVIARIVARYMSDELGQPVIVENKPGASAHIAAQDVMDSKPDGYKILATSLTLVVNPLIYPDRYRYRATDAFAPITNLVNLPLVVVAPHHSPWQTLQALIDYAKVHPDEITFASSGAGGSAHLAAEMLAVKAGINMRHIPYKGNGPALQETMAGRISFMFYPSIGIAGHVASGKLRVLATGTQTPMADFPDAPTLESLGLTGFEDGAPWVGLLAPAGTPQAIIDRLNQIAVAVLQRPEVRGQLGKLGAYVIGNTPEEFRDFLVKDKQRWSDVIERGQVKGQ